ncbi:MAG: WD40 repeat domain-containing protein, partial [Bacteroidota bacterium]
TFNQLFSRNYYPTADRILINNKLVDNVLIHSAKTQLGISDYKHDKEVTQMVYNQFGSMLLTAGRDKVIKLWKIFSLEPHIDTLVKRRIQVWEQQDKYESTTDFQQRVNPQNRQEKIKELRQQVIDQIAMNQVAQGGISSEYDPDQETFRLVFRGGSDTLFVKIPKEEAAEFDQQISYLELSQAHYTLSQEEAFSLVSTDIFNPIRHESYALRGTKYHRSEPKSLAKDKRAVNTLSAVENEGGVSENMRQGSNGQTPFLPPAEIDAQLPQTRMNNPNAIAVVIGNSQYKKTKAVDFAINDARSMRNYLIQVMGFKPGNIIYLEDALYTDFKLVFGTK